MVVVVVAILGGLSLSLLLLFRFEQKVTVPLEHAPTIVDEPIALDDMRGGILGQGLGQAGRKAQVMQGGQVGLVVVVVPLYDDGTLGILHATTRIVDGATALPFERSVVTAKERTRRGRGGRRNATPTATSLRTLLSGLLLLLRRIVGCLRRRQSVDAAAAAAEQEQRRRQQHHQEGACRPFET